MPVTHTYPISVWIIEDDVQFRKTLAYVLDHTTGLRCARTFEDCEAALALLRSGFPVEAPRVILLDIHLPGLSGLDGIRYLKAAMPLAAIIMLTISDNTDTIFTAFRAGASGYLPKSAPIDQIVTAVREAAQGGTLMPSLVAQKVLGFLTQSAVPPGDYGLTEREKDVLREMVRGLSQKQIATALGLSTHTVNSHVQHIYDKLHVHCGVEAVVKALRERLVTDDPLPG